MDGAAAGDGDVRSVLEARRRRQIGFHLRRGGWIAVIPVAGFALSAAGLAADRVLAARGAGLSMPQRGFLLFGLLAFGFGVVSIVLAPLRLGARVVPCFARGLGPHDGPGAVAFARGRALYDDMAVLDAHADRAAIARLSTFGFADDYYGDAVQWHPAADGLAIVEALQRIAGPGDTEAGELAGDLEALASVLRIAAGEGVAFCLTVRIFKKDSLPVVSSREPRAGRFW